MPKVFVSRDTTRDKTGAYKRGKSSARLFAGAGMVTVASILLSLPAVAEDCEFDPPTQFTLLAEVEPKLNITADCSDPYYRESSFVVTNTESLTYQVPDGPLIPYMEVSGYFPARETPLPSGVTISPTLNQQEYTLRFPGHEYWQNRSMQWQHPTTANSIVDNRLAFTNGAFTVNHVNASQSNAPGHFRHHAAATKVAESLANAHYGNTDKIYNYYWGCSGGGQMAQGAAEGQVGVWDGIVVVCPATRGNPTHSFQWQAHYMLALPEAKREQLSFLREVGNGVNATDGLTRDERALLYSGLNDEEKSVLNELLNAGFPLNELPVTLGFNFPGFGLSPYVPITGTNDIFKLDPTYESDFWDSGDPGYVGTNPPDYLEAAKMDGFATVTAINYDDDDAIVSIQLDPATIPSVPNHPIGTNGERYYVYAADGVTRALDPDASSSIAFGALSGDLNRTTGLLELSGSNSQILLDAVEVDGKIRVNNRFLLAAYYYPRHTIVPGYAHYDQYRNADGSPKYPQRPFSVADVITVRQAAGVLESGNITTKTMIFHNLSDRAAFPAWVAGYADVIEEALGIGKAKDMVRLYYQEKGGHSRRGLVAGIFNQALLDMMAWAERGIKPKRSSRFGIELGQVVLKNGAAQRKGLQPVIHLMANDGERAEVSVNEPVELHAKIQMPPSTGKVTEFSWQGLEEE
ncbi:hypothetical protein, partial [Pseudomaricurvus sp.]|uniref:hypothetical protein n=1 Tax=Pseudomaricurvus sp. TaxID=2004510 RepID=UPI003F6D1E37